MVFPRDNNMRALQWKQMILRDFGISFLTKSLFNAEDAMDFEWRAQNSLRSFQIPTILKLALLST